MKKAIMNFLAGFFNLYLNLGLFLFITLVYGIWIEIILKAAGNG